MKKEPSNYVVPTVIENTNRGERAWIFIQGFKR